MAKSQKISDKSAAAAAAFTNPSLSNSDTKPNSASASKAAPDPRVGKKLGKYLITGRLGKGGMGVVYEAEDTTLKRKVALKLLADAIASDPALLERFQREAQAAARLNHPNTVSIYEVSQHEGTHFLVMELVPGGSAEDVLHSRGAYDWREATRIVAEACRGLRAAHAADLIHRDIKPANIMCGKNGVVKLADFGLAKCTDATAVSLTGSETIVGTPNFMSPEQCRGEKVDPRTDIYSLGATYYTLLTGRLPFSGEGPVEVMFAHCANPIPDPRRIKPDIPEGISAIIHRALAKEPGERFDNAGELLAELKKYLAGGAAKAEATMMARKAPTTPKPVMPLNQAKIKTVALPKRRGKRRIPWVPIAAGTALAATLLAAALWMLPDKSRTAGDQKQLSALKDSGPSTSPHLASIKTNADPAPVTSVPRILIVIPFQNFWYPDYERVRAELARNGVKVVVASSQLGQATPAFSQEGPGKSVAVDVRLADARAEDYDTVIFSGGTPQAMGEFMLNEREGPSARRLISAMQAAGKPLAAICAGPAVLAAANVIKGKRVTCHFQVRPKVESKDHGGIFDPNQAVVVDGDIITARDWNASEEFVQTLLGVLKKKAAK